MYLITLHPILALLQSQVIFDVLLCRYDVVFIQCLPATGPSHPSTSKLRVAGTKRPRNGRHDEDLLDKLIKLQQDADKKEEERDKRRVSQRLLC